VKNSEKTTGWFRFQPPGWLRVTGDDALVFLQGQFTQDLVSLPLNRIGYGLWLTQKGRVVADSYVFKVGASELWLFSSGVSGTVLRERLEAYIIADDVVVEYLGVDCEGVQYLCPDEGGCGDLGLPDLLPGEWRRIGGAVVFRGMRGLPERSVTWIGPISERATIPAGMAALERDDLERMRIAAGVPRVPEDIGPGELPNEGGLERDAISYTKGCYLGQETIARLKAMGQVRRTLRRIRGVGAAPLERPQPLFQSGKRVGELKTTVPDAASGFVGFALITLLAIDSGAGLALAADAPETITLWP